MRLSIKRAKTPHVIFIPDDDEIKQLPSNKYIRAIYLQTQYKNRRMRLEVQTESKMMLEATHILGIGPNDSFQDSKPEDFMDIGWYSIEYLKELIRYSEMLGKEYVHFQRYKEGPLINRFDNEQFMACLAPRVEEEL